MKTIFVLAGIVIAFCSLVVSTGAQTTVIEIPQPKSVAIDFAEQSGSPLRLAIGKSPFTMVPAIPIELSNMDARSIRGYVLIMDTDGKKASSINSRPEKFIEKGTPQPHMIGRAQAENHIAISVDYVQFADGSEWGADEAGGSKIIAAYIQGRDLAMKRLLLMLAETNMDSTDFLGPIKAFGGFGLGGPTNMKHDPARFRLEGYRSVIKALRTPHKRVAESQDLARNLELSENSLEQ